MKLQRFVFLVAPICLAGYLHAQVSAPKLGVVRYADGTVRSIYGIEANFIVGKQMLPIADAVSFSDFGGLVAANGRIELVGVRGALVAQYNAHERNPLLNIDQDLTTAIAYLPSREALLHWNGKSLVLTQLSRGSFQGTVTSVQTMGAHEAKLLATTRDGNVSELTLSLDTGQLTSVKFLPGIEGPAFLHHAFVLFRGKHGLEVEAPDGGRRTVALAPKDLAIDRMSSDWLHLSSPATRQDWALQLNGSTLQLSELPAASAQGVEK